MDYTKIISTGLICIAAMEIAAIIQGINGTNLSVAVAAISGIVGASIKAYVDRRRSDGKKEE